jgi:hypothetical protein
LQSRCQRLIGAGAHSGAARNEALVRNVVFVASLICCLVLPNIVSGMTVAPGATVAKAAVTQIAPTAGGCGPGRHHVGPHGHCARIRH